MRDGWVAAHQLVSSGSCRQLAELHVITQVNHLQEQGRDKTPESVHHFIVTGICCVTMSMTSHKCRAA
jgi:hypothetical protein